MRVSSAGSGVSRAVLASRMSSWSLIALAIAGLMSPFSYNMLPAGGMLEIVFFLTALVVARLPRKNMIWLFLLAGLYVVVSFALMRVSRPANVLDFIQAYKAFIYIVPLCMFVRSGVFSAAASARLLKLLIVLFLIKYGYSLALDFNARMGSRPGIYVENNYELIFLILVFYVLRNALGPRRMLWLALLSVLVAISGSRSSVLALVVMFFGIYMTRLSLKTFFYALGFIVLLAGAALVFVERSAGGGVEDIDRYRFLMVFLSETSSWSIWNYAFGTMPLTPLSTHACNALSYYETLFSFSGDGSCYSVILHSYLLRALFDHGVLGLLFLLFFIARSLRVSGYSKVDVLVVLGVILSSAVSVSAMNSIFVSLGLMLALGMRREPAPTSPEASGN